MILFKFLIKIHYYKAIQICILNFTAGRSIEIFLVDKKLSLSRGGGISARQGGTSEIGLKKGGGD